MLCGKCSRVMLAGFALATLCLGISEGAVATPTPLNAAPVLPLKQTQATPESHLQKQDVLDKVEAMEMSDVTRENSKEGDVVRAPKVTESRSLSDESERSEDQLSEKPDAAKQVQDAEKQEPVKRKNIWHQLSGIVMGGKGASPSPARQASATKSEPEPQQEPVQRKNIWHQLSGIVIGGKPASPSPARSSIDATPRLREKSLARDAAERADEALHKVAGKAPTVPPLKEAKPQTPAEREVESVRAKGAVQGAGLEQANFTVNVYPVEDANMVRWAPMKLDDQVLVPVYFKPKPKHLQFTNETRDVTLVGSWSGWQDHFKLQPKGNTGCWDGVVNIPVGRHYFKFIVDDEWTIVGQWPVETDDEGTTNNVIEIPEPSSGMLMQERKSVFAKKKKNFLGF